MKPTTPKRIVIIGLPGSGKSTLAVRLGALLHVPVHHLDRQCFIGSVKRDPEEFVFLQQKIVDQESWIIEGCSIKTLEMRFERADAVIYLHFSRLLCLWRVCKRSLFPNDVAMQSGCASFVNWTLAEYIWNFTKEKNEKIYSLKNQYPDVPFYEIFSPKEIERCVGLIHK